MHSSHGKALEQRACCHAVMALVLTALATPGFSGCTPPTERTTFRVYSPRETDTSARVFVTGSFNAWDHADSRAELRQVDPHHFEGTIVVPSDSIITYHYTRGGIERREVDAFRRKTPVRHRGRYIPMISDTVLYWNDDTTYRPRLVLQDAGSKIDSLLAPLVRPHGPGACVLVTRRDSLVFARGYGLANVEASIPVTTATNFRIASLTKQFTAAAILLLVREGKMTLEDRIDKFFPVFPPVGKSISVRHLLTHTSGLVAYEDCIPRGQKSQVKDNDVLTLVRAVDTTYFPPGTRYRYSNTGYALLALVVEKVSGLPFAGYLKKMIFEPLEMRGTVAHEEGISVVENRAFGYTGREFDREWRFERTDQSLTSAVLGDGGIYSSVDDLSRWHHSLDQDLPLGRELTAEAFTGQKLADGSPADYGLGWGVGTYRGMKSCFHGGSSIGFSHAVRRLQADGLVVILLTNQNDISAFDYLDRIVDLYYQDDPDSLR